MLPPMFPDFNALVMRAAFVIPGGYEAHADAPHTLIDCLRAYRQHGKVIVWSGASERTIYGDPAVNHAFRAWHDYQHIVQRAEFDDHGERLVYHAQRLDVLALAPNPAVAAQCCRVLHCEVIGQLDHMARFGRFPTDQRRFASEYLAGRLVAC